MIAMQLQTWLVLFVVWHLHVEVNYDEPNYFDGPSIYINNFGVHTPTPVKVITFHYADGSSEALAYRLETKVLDWESPW